MVEVASPPSRGCTRDEVRAAFFEMIELSIDESGLRLHRAVDLSRDARMNVYALALGPQTDQEPGIFTWLINHVDSDATDFLIAGVDMRSAPGQGLEFDDFVLVLEFDRDRPAPFLTSQWRYGVINYRTPAAGVEKIVRPVDWANSHWCGTALGRAGAGAYYMNKLGPPFRAIVKRRRETGETGEVSHAAN